MIPNSVGVSHFSNVLQLFCFPFLCMVQALKTMIWFNVSFNYFWMYLNREFYLIPVWHLILKGSNLGRNIWYADVTTNFVTDSVNLVCHFMARQTPRWDEVLLHSAHGRHDWHTRLNRALYGSDLSHCFPLAKRSIKGLNGWKMFFSISLFL